MYAHSKAELRKPDAKLMKKTPNISKKSAPAELMEHVTFASALLDGRRLRTISEGSRFSHLSVGSEVSVLNLTVLLL